MKRLIDIAKGEAEAAISDDSPSHESEVESDIASADAMEASVEVIDDINEEKTEGQIIEDQANEEE
jgi:hypothetical protein